MIFFLRSPFAFQVKGLCLFGILLISQLLSCDVVVWGQEKLKERIKAYKPQERLFIKDKLIFGYQILGDALSELPKEIREGLGKVDQTVYTDAMLRANEGSFIALQMKDGIEFDFYVIDQEHFKRFYRKVPLQEAFKNPENKKLLERLLELPSIKELIKIKSDKIWGLIKTSKMKMIKMSEIGFLKHDNVQIQTPWATQTKPVNLDAYLAYDSIHSIYYLVNEDETGYPINYIPVCPNISK